MLRTLPVADRAAIAVLEPGATGPATKQADLAAVRAGLDLVRVYRLRLAAGTVTGMDPIYVP